MTASLPLVVEGVSASYGTHVALRDVSFHVEAGTVVALLGPNGAGKTTLATVISGLMRPTAGQVTILGEPVTPMGNGAFRRLIGWAPQDVSLYQSLTVEKNMRSRRNTCSPAA